MLAAALVAILSLVGCAADGTDGAAPDADTVQVTSDRCCSLLPDQASAQACARDEVPTPGVCFVVDCSGGEVIETCTPKGDDEHRSPVTPR